MWFGKSEEEKRQEAENEKRNIETQEALANGQLPSYVSERLQNQKNGNMPWTSTLSVNDWVVIKNFGIEPIGQVMGSSYYHIGYSMANYGGQWGSGNLSALERALYENRELALERLKLEAKELGAQAVVDVKLIQKNPGFYSHAVEFVAVGTAVKIKSKVPVSEPVLCGVDASELAKLMLTGMFPVGFVLGVSVYYQYTSWNDKNITRSFFFSRNQEMTNYTQAVSRVQHQAINNMKAEARKLSAKGVLAHDTNFKVIPIEVERGKDDDREDHILEFIATGTAVIEFSSPTTEEIQIGLPFK